METREFFATLVCREYSFEYASIDIAAAHHADDLLPGELTPQFFRSRQRRGAGALREIVCRPHRQANSIREFLFRQRDDVIEFAFQDVEREIEGDARGHPFGERVGPLADDARGTSPRSCERVGALRLHADDLRATADGAADDRAAARAAAAADRHED